MAKRRFIGGPLGDILVDYMKAHGGFITREDLTSYKTVERAPIRADYRGWEILGPPPPAASGVHIAQMLNILEGYDIAANGFGTAETIHLLAEVLKIAFADRAAASGDPDFIGVPVRAADLEGLCRASAARAIDLGARAAMGRRRRAARKRAHHAHDGGGCDRQRGRDHADHQQSVRRQDPDPGPRHRAEQLHEPVRSRGPATRCRWRRASASPPRCRR